VTPDLQKWLFGAMTGALMGALGLLYATWSDRWAEMAHNIERTLVAVEMNRTTNNYQDAEIARLYAMANKALKEENDG